MHVAITCGGTGGHVYPGVALAEELRARGHSVVWIGSRDGMEEAVATSRGIAVRLLAVRGKPRRGVFRKAVWIAETAIAVLSARRVLRRERPDVVAGLGGFASGPAGYAAVKLGIPLVVLEQNVRPGWTTRRLARHARRVCVTFEATRSAFPASAADKAVVTGNPLRREALEGSRAWGLSRPGFAPGRPTLVIVGGSQGARRINKTTAAALEALLNGPRRPQVIWILGRRDYPAFSSLPVTRHPGVCAEAYVEAMGNVYASADLIISRAGATTLAEISAWGIPAILIPYPFATENDQANNAAVLVSSGAAEAITDDDLSAERLTALVARLLGSPDTLERMRKASRALGRPDAAAAVADILEAQAGKGLRDES